MAVHPKTSLRLFTVDSFSSVPFAGNPAAVCLDDTPQGLSETLMQSLATEMNISETCFIKPQSEGSNFVNDARFNLRWFTPTNEVPLCGHATLASAAVLFNCIGNKNKEIIFDTKSGPLYTQKEGTGIKMVLPSNPPEPFEMEKVQKLIELLNTDFKPLALVRAANADVLIRLPDNCTRTDLELLKPNVEEFMKAENSGLVRGVIVTCKGSVSNGAVDSLGRQYDFMSRYFAPWNGIREDPACGAAHTVLGPYWAKELGKTQLYARQCSKRGGELRVSLRDDGRLDVFGEATVVMKAEISL